MSRVSPGARASVLHVVARWLAPVVLGIIAFALVLQITDPPGPGLDSDAVSYLGAAESLVARGELRVPSAHWSMSDSTTPLTRFPPGYSVAIAVPTRLGLGPVQSARLVNALAAFVMVTCLVLLVADATTRVAGLLFGCAVLAMPALFEVHVSVLSEPLYLALTALTLDAMVRRPERPALALVPAGLSMLVRYAGVSLVVTAAVWALLRPGPIVQRARSTLAALALGTALPLLWLFHTSSVGSADSIRRIAVYGDVGRTIEEGIGTVASWLVPPLERFADPLPYRTHVAVLILLVLLVVVVRGLRTIGRARSAGARASGDAGEPVRLAGRVLAAAALTIACYLAVVLASRLLADPDIPFDQRILSPVLLLATMLVFVASYYWWRETPARWPRIALVCAGLAWWTASALTTYRDARRVRILGSDYERERWWRSDLIAWARVHGAGHVLFTNRPAAVYFHLHRPARDVPLLEEAGRVEEFADSVRALDGRVLMFGQPTRWFVSAESLQRVRGLRPLFVGTNGIVLGPP